MFERESSSNLVRFVKESVKHRKQTYGKDGVLIDAVSENTKVL